MDVFFVVAAVVLLLLLQATAQSTPGCRVGCCEPYPPPAGWQCPSSCLSVGPGYTMDGSTNPRICEPGAYCLGSPSPKDYCSHWCPAGTYQPLSGQTSCAGTRCAAGRFGLAARTNASVVECLTCPAGTYAAATGSSTCSQCPPGRYGASPGMNASDCTDVCAAGRYANGLVGATSMLCDGPCQAGRYSNTTATSVLCNEACPAGRYSNSTGATSSNFCDGQCNPGRYAAGVAGASSAECDGPCAAGRYGSAAGSTSSLCTGQCEANYYCPEGSIIPSACQLHSSSPASSGAATSCACDPGYAGPSGGPCDGMHVVKLLCCKNLAALFHF